MGTGLAQPDEVADYLGYSVAGLNQMRYMGKGPKFIKITGRAVRYRWVDVEAWLDSQTQTRTGDKAVSA